MRNAWLSIGTAFLALSGVAVFGDTVTAVGIGAFGSAATIDFSALPNDTLITNQFTGQNLTVSGGLYADTINGSTYFGKEGASNFLPSNPGPGPYNSPIVLTFSSPVTLVGMFGISNTGTFNISSAGGTIGYPSRLASGFFGFEDPAGFTSVSLFVNSGINNAFTITDLKFGQVAATPEPSSALLLFGGLTLFESLRRMRRRRA